MGVASVYDALNVHTEPSRQSPSFAQIPEGGKVEVIGHKVTPRVQAPPPPPAPEPTTRPGRKSKKKDKEKEKEAAKNKVPPPPPPPAPKLPSDWLVRSRSALPADLKVPEKEPPPPVKLDDWSLVRTKDHKVGWVLSRQLTMAIPDDVAQYAEGHRITSYFSLGDVPVDDQTKHHWLWTTISSNGESYDFDSFRVFIWSLRHHRYETAYIERNVTGFLPVEVKPGAEPRFSLILRDGEGNLYRKTFSFNGIRAQFISREPYQAPGEGRPEIQTATNSGPSAGIQKESFLERVKKRFSGWKKKLTGN